MSRLPASLRPVASPELRAAFFRACGVAGAQIQAATDRAETEQLLADGARPVGHDGQGRRVWLCPKPTEEVSRE